ncbi:putative transmembrane protein [Senna tora]|uniref:Putative transmembrane protein n=1 Tax=Senna tora TaxID=362788 RepID=A0A834U429_9FABA|nr:putative transmembrane protein [Senna tora]
MELGGSSKRSSFSSSKSQRVIAIGLAILAVASPLYIDSKSASELEEEEEAVNLAFLLPLLLFVLILAIVLSAFLDRSFTRFDRYWIYRVGGSSGGIVMILILLFLVLKWKASL